MHILDIPFRLLPAPPAELPQPKNLPALPDGELESLLKPRVLLNCHSERAAAGEESAFLEMSSEEPETACTYQTSSDRPCPRPVIHYADKEEPEEYCAAHLAWIEKVEEKFDVPYPESPQALLDLLAHTTAQVLARKIMNSEALTIIQLARAMERQLRWM